MNTLFKSLLQCFFPLAFIGLATPSWADVVVPVDEVLSELQGQTQVPIFIPTEIPTIDVLYTEASGNSDGYYIDFNADPCYSTACNFATLEVRRDGRFTRPDDLGPNDSAIEIVALPSGIRGQHVNICGPYCRAYVEWEYEGVFYSASVKNGTREDALAIARSAIANGVIEPETQSSNSPQGQSCVIRDIDLNGFSGDAFLTSEDSGSRINIRTAPTTESAIRHIGYAGDPVVLTEVVVGENNYCWCQVDFVQSEASGWVRGDFVTDSFNGQFSE